MKNIVVIMSLLILGACSSKPEKKDPPPADPAPVVTEATEPVPTPEPVPEPSKPDPMAEMVEKTKGMFPDIEGTERMAATCMVDKDTRTITTLDIPDGGGCGVVYGKNGTKQTVAMAKHDMSFCDKVFDNIKGNLTNGGFDCGGGGKAATAEEPASAQ